jgi:hypothetical protein
MIEKLWTTCVASFRKTSKIFPFVLYNLNTEVGAGVSAMKVKAPSAKEKAQIPAFSPCAV